jgi:uncharacterized protein YndB with AHSA1/START domain
MKNACSIEIEAPIELVFDLIHDPQKHKLWLQGLEETIHEPDYDPDHPLGAKFKQKIRGGKDAQVYDGEVTAFEKPSHLGVRLSSRSLTAQVDYRLKSLKKATRVDFTSELTFKSVAFRVMATVSGPLLRGILQKQLNKLKELAEAGK